ncbi:hypothetical protein COCCADRAFT_92366 [Bipolaris zeicola 26-R-13]|uniref:Uncharacterized protein n=1 Tax=Cochliobolus carbonum (strain 26-R-13) TaxID=930089 RepID=W6YA63_COCC2|nr:uncharacterized protein COCCADRAFT_92366 [Bipolaris zeicola 26-R-13]EUC34858.1 hypothetical protein COCCADRAFT_92366 [Bipolaris zeicola 26-R-13]
MRCRHIWDFQPSGLHTNPTKCVKSHFRLFFQYHKPMDIPPRRTRYNDKKE